MAKFKVGDRVRRLTYNSRDMIAGSEWVVESTAESLANDEWISLVGYKGGACRSTNFELITPTQSPAIRTVTRREIMPGTYGGVTVERIPFAGIEIKYSGYGNVHNLREAARLFNDIADVLDENNKKEAA